MEITEERVSELEDCIISVALAQRVLTEGDFVSPRDIWNCLRTFLAITTGGLSYWHLVVKARDPAKYPTMHWKCLPQTSDPKCQMCQD